MVMSVVERHDHIALADVRCVVTAGLGGASLRLLCLLLFTMELSAIFILTDLVQWYNSQMFTGAAIARVRFSPDAPCFFFFFFCLADVCGALSRGLSDAADAARLAPQP